MALKDLLKNSQLTLASKAKEALDWLRNSIRNILTGKTDDPLDPKDQLIKVSAGDIEHGKLYLMSYDPFHKDKLPYWDEWPLVFRIGDKKPSGEGAGFLGLNLHYLTPRYRILLMDAFLEAKLQNNDKFDETTYLAKISYEVLKASSSNFPGFENCVKLYLYKQIRGVYLVPAERWSTAVMLPLQQWKTNPNPRYRGTPPY